MHSKSRSSDFETAKRANKKQDAQKPGTPQIAAQPTQDELVDCALVCK